MKNIFTCLSVLALSTGAMALDLNLNAMDDHQGGHQGDPCAHMAWKATNPTADQNQQAMELMMAVRDLAEQSKDSIIAAKRNMMVTMMAHPINKAAAEAGGKTLHDLIAPIQQAMFGASIDAINLLTVTQRDTFDRTMMHCKMHGGGGHGGGGQPDHPPGPPPGPTPPNHP